MPRKNHGDQDGAAGSKFYLPVGVTPSRGAGRLERIWTTLFDRRV
jgi:hypothetical protein